MNPFKQIAAIYKAAPKMSAIAHEDAPFSQVGNIFAKFMALQKGTMTIGHSHRYDHMTILGSGVLKVVTPLEEVVYHAPAEIEIKANIHHALIALEDVNAWCVHDVSVADPEDLGEPF